MSFCFVILYVTIYVASRNEWQSDYDTPGETSHYYSIVKKDLYGGKYPNPLKSFMSTELDPKILLDTKKSLDALVKFLDSLTQLLC